MLFFIILLAAVAIVVLTSRLDGYNKCGLLIMLCCAGIVVVGTAMIWGMLI